MANRLGAGCGFFRNCFSWCFAAVVSMQGHFGETGAASGCVKGAWGCFSSKSLERVWDSRSRLILNPLIVCFGNFFFFFLKNHPWKWGRALQS